ncbi:hypothetical protein, partial [Streptomyces sp. f51]|uniref:hypothetical protein n=1 Tax=Streptomyces sp. f51 TaxID=1827742 RepID=UPI0035A14C50
MSSWPRSACRARTVTASGPPVRSASSSSRFTSSPSPVAGQGSGQRSRKALRSTASRRATAGPASVNSSTLSSNSSIAAACSPVRARARVRSSRAESGDRGSARGAAGRLQRQGPVEGHRLPERLHRPLGVPVPLQVRTERLEGAGQLGQKDVSPVAQQLDGLPCRGQGLLRATGDGRAPGEGAQRGGEAGAEGFGALRGQLPV